jgi:hypothetical protein
MDSLMTRSRRTEVEGRKAPRKALHSRGDSSMVKKVNTAMAPMVINEESAAAPTDSAVAGLSTLVSCLVSLAEPSDRYFCRWSRKTSRPSGPLPLRVLLMRLGISWPKCTALLTRGETKRYTRPRMTTRPPTKITVAAKPCESPVRRRRRIAGVKSKVRKNAITM